MWRFKIHELCSRCVYVRDINLFPYTLPTSSCPPLVDSTTCKSMCIQAERSMNMSSSSTPSNGEGGCQFDFFEFCEFTNIAFERSFLAMLEDLA